MIWIYNARIAAAFAVVVLHISAWYVGKNLFPTSTWWAGNVFDSITRWCVPVFVMISGFLMLSSQKDTRIIDFYRKRAKRILVPLVFWTLFYNIVKIYEIPENGASANIVGLLKMLFMQKPYYHLWYIYMIPGLYLFAPFVNKLINALSNKELFWFCVVCFLIVIANSLLNYPNKIPVKSYNVYLLYMPYFMAGGLIRKTDYQLPLRISGPALAIAFIVTIFGTYYNILHDIPLWFYLYTSIPTMLASIGIFFIFKKNRRYFLKENTTQKLASLTYGIYLIHPFVMFVLHKLDITRVSIMPIIFIPAFGFLVFILSAFLSLLISRIPFLKWTI